ncbi:MAG: hypothetical protein D4R65_08880 [Verrucomicrobiaceae bacterium]|nr:MAG: hypothetical protein D4R65_08880 [Verrucomicrobiaceae bacterium]
MTRLERSPARLSLASFFAAVLLGPVAPVGAAGSEPGTGQTGAAPRIFIGTAWADRLEELRDTGQWAEVAPHVGLFVHPGNINANSTQIELLKELSPCFGVREAIIERNAIPTEEDVFCARDVVRDLKRREALPWAWGIEDYSKNSDLHMVPERNADGLALWIRDFYAGKVE